MTEQKIIHRFSVRVASPVTRYLTTPHDDVSAKLAIFPGNSSVTGEFPAQRPVTRSFDVFLVLRPNKRLSKQSRGWWFQMHSRPLWRHCNLSASLPGVVRLASRRWRHSDLNLGINSYIPALTHWGRDKMAATSQTTLSNAFSWMKISEFRLEFHWSLFPSAQLTIFQHWFI